MLAPFFDYLRGFAPSRQPAMARPGYRRELVSFATLPCATALIEGAVVSILAKLHFEVSEFGFATIIAAPMLATLILLGRYIMRKMFDLDPWEGLERRQAPPLKIPETVRAFFSRFPFVRAAAPAEDESVNATPEETE